MQFEGALIREQGLTFAVVIVKPHVLNSGTQADDVADSFRPAFPGVPIVLMAQNGRGVPTYRGRRDIVNFLSRVPMQAIPWRRYTLN
jgi:hypothetical protein